MLSGVVAFAGLEAAFAVGERIETVYTMPYLVRAVAEGLANIVLYRAVAELFNLVFGVSLATDDM